MIGLVPFRQQLPLRIGARVRYGCVGRTPKFPPGEMGTVLLVGVDLGRCIVRFDRNGTVDALDSCDLEVVR